MGNINHVLLSSGDLHHIKDGAHLNLQRGVTFGSGDCHDGWCTKKCEDGLGDEREP